MVRLLAQQNKPRKDEKQKINWQIIHNYSTYTKSDEEYQALYFGPDAQIPVKVNKTAVYKDFQVFFHSLLKDISNILKKELTQIKTNLRNTCDKYTKIRVPYKYGKVV